MKTLVARIGDRCPWTDNQEYCPATAFSADFERMRVQVVELKANQFAAAAAECLRMAAEEKGEDGADGFWSSGFWKHAAEHFECLAEKESIK